MTTRNRPFALGSFALNGGRPFLGLVLDAVVFPVSKLAPGAFAPGIVLLDLLEIWPRSFTTLSRAVAAGVAGGGIPIGELSIEAPLPNPRQIFCTGANYAEHRVEMMIAMNVLPPDAPTEPKQRQAYATDLVARQAAVSEPYVFMKTITSLAGPRSTLVLPTFSQKADWELELGVVIGRPTYKVARQEAMAMVAGYMVVNDMTIRDMVRRSDPGALGPDWIAAKGSPGFLPIGPYFVPAEFVPDPHKLRMHLTVNGETMQDACTDGMIFDIPRQIEFIARYARMLPGDIICTGSPAGNGIARGIFLRDGDVMEAEIELLGRQEVRCVSAGGTRT